MLQTGTPGRHHRFRYARPRYFRPPQHLPFFRHLAEQSPEKVLNASWAALQEGQVFAVDVEIRAQDRSGLLRDVSDALARHKLNVTAVQTQSRDLEASMRFTLEVRQVNDLPRVLASLGDIKGVLSVTRL